MKKSRTNSFSKKLFQKNPYSIFAIVVILIVGFILFFRNQISRERIITPTADVVLEDLQKQVGVNTSLKEAKQNWRDTVNTWVPLVGMSFTNEKMLSIYDIQTLRKSIDQFFKSNGYTINTMNTIDQLRSKGLMQQLRLAYEKNNTQCLISLYPSSNPSGSFFCGSIDQNQLTLRQEFEKDFKDSLLSSANQVALKEGETEIIDPEKIVGNYARGTDNRYNNGVYETSGSVWIATKVNGKWIMVSNSQQYPFCDDMDKYSIPKEIYRNCFISHSSDATTRFTNNY